MKDMRLEFPLIVLVALLLLDGCGSRSGSTEASIPHAQEPPPQQRGSPSETPGPAYDMPLEIHIDAPSPPREIVGPSPPVPPETPFPRGLIDGLFKGSSK